jgi:hypothetical protein
VMPLEKSGFYEQAAGWCAELHDYERGDCREQGWLLGATAS